jgi:fatty-acyl-CoA synthase
MALLYSSGTTGRPKGIVITRNNGLYSALNFALVGAVGPDTVALLDLPIFHTIGLVAVTRTTLTMGGTLVISDRFDPARTLAAFGDAGIGVTHYFCVPQMAAALRRHPDFDAGRLNRLRAIFVGGAPVPAQLIADWLADGIPLANGFGMTEAGTVMHMPLDPEAVRQNPGSIGLPAPFLEVRLVDAAGRDVADGAAGDLWLRGPSVTPGYKTPPPGETPFFDGWYRTGDLLVREANGFYRLVDRLKDIYISGGENVFPGEVEAVLLACPGVAEAAVFGVPDEKWGEVGLAHVVAAKGASLDPAAVAAFCETRLARYKRPREIRVVEALPRTASGKILKHVLRRDHAAARTLSSSERSAS